MYGGCPDQPKKTADAKPQEPPKSLCPNNKTTQIYADSMACYMCTDWCANGYVQAQRKLWDCYDRTDKSEDVREQNFTACCIAVGGKRWDVIGAACTP